MKDLTQENKAKIDAMSYVELLRLWRHTPTSGDQPLFEGNTGKYFAERMMEKKAALTDAEQVAASKLVGW